MKLFKKYFRQFAIAFKKRLQQMENVSGFTKWSLVKLHALASFIIKPKEKREKTKNDRMQVILENLPEEEHNNRKLIKKLDDDILFCRIMYGLSNQEYFTYEFNMLSHEGRKTFVTRSNKYPYYQKFNNQNYIMYLNKKTEMCRKFGKFYGRDIASIIDESDYESFLAFIEKHPKFIYKPSDDYGGNGIEIIDSSKARDSRELFDILLSQGAGVAEELIVQGEALAKFHPASVNTVRIVTFLKNDGSIDIQWCFLRMGMGGSHTDNMSGGGLSAQVDPKTGIIYSTGRDWKGEECMCHPDTGVQLIGAKMPEWDKALELLAEVSHVLPQLRLVGWDLAYSDRGWVLIEGNSRPQCVSAQISKYNGKLHLLKKMEKEFDEGR